MTTDFLTPAQPDILEVISNLSNDEVFTPPRVVNAVLDMLPESVWNHPALRWLDPGCKTGVFPREITKRLMKGLATVIPNESDRLDHILKNMVFAIAITEITSLMARRTLYCSKDAGGEHSAVEMASGKGNIWFERVEHSFVNGRCSECGGTESQLEREGRDNYAYGFIHEGGRAQIEKEMDMKFDVIVGNPPYQMDDEGGHRPVPIYNRFVEIAIGLNPKYVAMITPSRWMAGGLGLKGFREDMLSDARIRRLVNFPVASELFGGVEIKGGVCYFLWERDHPGLCSVTTSRNGRVSGPVERDLGQFDVFVRDSKALPILQKVITNDYERFSDLVASVRPFGDKLRSNFKGFTATREHSSFIKLFMNEGHLRRQNWVDPAFVTNNNSLARAWKVYLPKAGSDGGQRIPDQVLGKAFIGPPKSVCTETYLAIGPFSSESSAQSAESFLRTRFARFLISLRKIAQDNVPSTFVWVPQQNWDRTWTDEELFKKYKITKEEQAYIAEMVKEMPV